MLGSCGGPGESLLDARSSGSAGSAGSANQSSRGLRGSAGVAASSGPGRGSGLLVPRSQAILLRLPAVSPRMFLLARRCPGVLGVLEPVD